MIDRWTIARLPLIGRLSLTLYRGGIGARSVVGQARRVARWLLVSKEISNFTYDLTPVNFGNLASFVAHVTGVPIATALAYLGEPQSDTELSEHIRNTTSGSDQRCVADSTPRFGRRIGWYALVRATKPRVVVETGVDKGLGACLIAAALRKNSAEGSPGRYFGTDINPRAGYLLSGVYAAYGKVLYGDSLASLRTLDEQVDLFINDSDHSAEYEALEYAAIAEKLTPAALVVGDNSHCTLELQKFSMRTAREFLFFQEQPADHWYPGAGIGCSFRLRHT